MSVRIRLQRHGRKQTPIYHIVIADARSPRDGSFIERIGMYNPMTKPATIEIDRMKAYEWLRNGAQPTDTVHAILRFKGVMYYKHLQRGVGKGAMSPEEAEEKFRTWVDAKEARIEERVRATAAERKERAIQVSGSKKSPKKKAVEQEDELLNVNLAESAAAETADQAPVDAASENVAANEESAETSNGTTDGAADATAEPALVTADETSSEAAESSTETAEASDPTADSTAEPAIGTADSTAEPAIGTADATAEPAIGTAEEGTETANEKTSESES